MDERALKILMLDDDEDEYLIARRLLARGGPRHALEWTADPEVALADMRRGAHDVYLVDYRLGAVTGIDVIREAVQAGVKAPLILLTGTSVEDTASGGDAVDIEALRSGAADYLVKHGLTAQALQRSIRYARERAHSAALRESLGRAEQEGVRLEALLARVTRQERRLELLAECSKAFALVVGDAEEKLVDVARRCADVLGQACVVALITDDGANAVIRAFERPGSGGGEGAQLAGLRLPLDGSVLGETIRKAQPCVVAIDATNDRDGAAAAFARAGATAALLVPVACGTDVVGTMGLLSVSIEGAARFDEDVVGVMAEIGRRAGLALKSARLYRDLQTAVRIRDEFLSVAGHELKTPLAAMLMIVETLARAAQPDDSAPHLRDRLARLASAGRRLASLIDQLLDVSRITAGRFQLEPEPMSLDDLVREVVARFAEYARRTQSPLGVRLERGVTGRWDRMRLDQVATNLLANALKYGKGKPIEIVVETRGDDAVLRVLDHGIGIAVDQQRRIFDRFERAVATREYGGFGLGLWITRQIVEASGGRIEVQSRPGEGARFTVILPRDAKEERQ